ncbi:hypothetical protein D3C87_774250 [compost metagenome]
MMVSWPIWNFYIYLTCFNFSSICLYHLSMAQSVMAICYLCYTLDLFYNVRQKTINMV